MTRFFDLPAEMRHMVYDELFPLDIDWLVKRPDARVPLTKDHGNLALTCRQFYIETQGYINRAHPLLLGDTVSVEYDTQKLHHFFTRRADNYPIWFPKTPIHNYPRVLIWKTTLSNVHVEDCLFYDNGVMPEIIIVRVHVPWQHHFKFEKPRRIPGPAEISLHQDQFASAVDAVLLKLIWGFPNVPRIHFAINGGCWLKSAFSWAVMGVGVLADRRYTMVREEIREASDKMNILEKDPKVIQVTFGKADSGTW